MNIERMLYLADQLEHPTDPKMKHVTFDMKDFTSGSRRTESAISCGTAACIGGTACILFGANRISCEDSTEILELNRDEAIRLFYNYENYVSPRLLPDITREEAVAAIRRMAQEHIDASVSALIEDLPSIKAEERAGK